jgi:hypothetical protein
MEEGCAGKIVMFTFTEEAVLVPQLLTALTCTVPPVVVVSAVITVEVEEPVQPDGKDQR